MCKLKDKLLQQWHQGLYTVHDSKEALKQMIIVVLQIKINHLGGHPRFQEHEDEKIDFHMHLDLIHWF